MDSSAQFTLSVLPPEIVEEILTYLDLATLKALRLSSRALCEDSTSRCFKRFIRVQSIELRQSSLESLQSLLAHPILGPAVEDLEIVATIYDQTACIDIARAWEKKQKARDQPPPNPPTCIGFRSLRPDPSREDLLQADDNMAWLRAQQLLQDEFSYDEAVKQLTFCLSRIRKLRRIELDAVLVQGPNARVTTDTGRTNWYPVWMHASRNYCITMEALTRSNVELKTLNVYQRTPRCSVPLYDIATNMEMLDTDSLLNIAKSLEDLSLSISNKVATGATDRPPRMPITCHAVAWYGKKLANAAYVSSLGGDPGGDERFDGLARLLSLTSNLKALDIHFYNTTTGRFVGSHSILEAVSKETLLPYLRKCSIGGIITTPAVLIRFLSNHPNITNLSLNRIELASGESWKPIFTHLEQRMPELEHLRLSTLKDCDGQSINLHPVWDEHPEELEVNRLYSIFYVHTKNFTADDILKGLEFREMPFAPSKGSPEAAKWATSLRAHYGAPWEHKREFISSDIGQRA